VLRMTSAEDTQDDEQKKLSLEARLSLSPF
jgi:hypothetical protein